MRSTGRSKELAVPKALGASGCHVASEVLVETTLLPLTGGLLGCIAGGRRHSLALSPGRRSLAARIADPIRHAIGVRGAGWAIILGLLPRHSDRLVNHRAYPGNALQSEGRSGTSSLATQRLRHGFIVAQIALAFVLLTGAGLLGLSLKRATKVSPGFRSDHVLTGLISLPSTHCRRSSLSHPILARASISPTEVLSEQ
jgi:putative ABC transport system permease protein